MFAKCQKILRHATVCSHLWHDTDENSICVYYFFIHLSRSSQLKYIFIFMFSHTFTASPSPLLHTLFFSPLPFFSILFQFMNNEPPPISSLPFHKFRHHWSIKSPSPVFFPPFFCSLLSILSHTTNQFSSSQSCQFAVQSRYRQADCFASVDAAPSNPPLPKSARSH